MKIPGRIATVATCGMLGMAAIGIVQAGTVASASADTLLSVAIPGCSVTVESPQPTIPIMTASSNSSCDPLGLGGGFGPQGLLPTNIPVPKGGK